MYVTKWLRSLLVIQVLDHTVDPLCGHPVITVTSLSQPHFSSGRAKLPLIFLSKNHPVYTARLSWPDGGRSNGVPLYSRIGWCFERFYLEGDNGTKVAQRGSQTAYCSLRRKQTVPNISLNNPFTPESDQCQISPAASPEILHHTVRRTWLFIAYSDERWL